jgi:hypothetical protein
MTAAERAASIGADYIRTPEFEGVIFPEGFNCLPDYWLFPYWTPSRDLVLTAETRLLAFLNDFPPDHAGLWDVQSLRYAIPLILPNLPRYRRQYWGIVYGDHAMLYMNFFARDGWDDWVTHQVGACDGGHDYFQAIYHPDRDEFAEFSVNGEA